MNSFIFWATAIMSVMTFFLFGIDKRRAVLHKWRIPEATLLSFSVLFGGLGGLAGMLFFRHKTRKWKFRLLVPFFALLQILLIAFILWDMDVYAAGSTAMLAMESDDVVNVRPVSSGWIFDGPSEDEMLIFYPGAKVEATAYAPLLHDLAADGVDACLAQMPLNLAFLGINDASSFIEQTYYSHYYIGGHSLGGAMAAYYAADHDVEGLVLLAAYPVKETACDMLLLYGTEDEIVNQKKISKAKTLASGRYMEYEMKGANHAQFGDYGEQKGDGRAFITAKEQQEEAARLIVSFLKEGREQE